LNDDYRNDPSDGDRQPIDLDVERRIHHLDLHSRTAPDRFFKEPLMPPDFSPQQKKIINRYYDNLDTLQLQRLAQLVGELYLSEGKKRERTWKQVGECLEKLGLAQSRVDHLMQQRKPELVAEVVKEMEAK